MVSLPVANAIAVQVLDQSWFLDDFHVNGKAFTLSGFSVGRGVGNAHPTIWEDPLGHHHPTINIEYLSGNVSCGWISSKKLNHPSDFLWFTVAI